LLALPLLAYTVLLFVIPAISVVRTSITAGSGLSGGGITAEHYSEFFSDSFYLKALWNTLSIALLTVLIAGVIGLVYAYLLSTKPRFRRAQMALLLAPLLINGVVRIFGLQLGLNALNRFLQWAHIIDSPLPLLYSYPAIVIALVMFEFPYMALAIYASLARLDPALVEAARTLGAGRVATTVRIILPAALPGVVAGSVLTFAGAAGSYIVPAMMGGGRTATVPVMIYNAVSQTSQWGTGSAFAVILSVVLIVPILAFSRQASENTAGTR
jgi:putative spermidine/putrescine transport system permease protein